MDRITVRSSLGGSAAPAAGGATAHRGRDCARSAAAAAPRPRWLLLAAAVFVSVLAPARSVTCTTTAPCATVGAWGEHIAFNISPAAGALVPYAKGVQAVLWSAALAYQQGTLQAQTAYCLMDATARQPTDAIIAKTNHDMFCPGMSATEDGSSYVTGGYGGARPGSSRVSDASVVSSFNTSSMWTAQPHMNVERAYHASTVTSVGDIFVIGGSFGLVTRGGKIGEVWTPGPNNAWRNLSNIQPEVIYTNDQEGVYRADNHAWLFGWSNGSVFHAGPSIRMNWFQTNVENGTSKFAGNRTWTDQMNGNAVMYDSRKILTVGGAANYGSLPGIYGNVTIAVNTANVITLNAPGDPVTVEPTSSLKYNRTFAMSVALPTGDVLTVGGQLIPKPFYDSNAVLIPELWQRATGKWLQLAKMPRPRCYHSLTLLLPDASVLVAGGGLCPKKKCPAQHRDGDVYYPPYFFNADGSAATRPVITAPPSAAVGSTFTVTSDTDIATFALVRFGSSTHAVDTDQRRIEPSFASTSTPQTYLVTLPSDSGVVTCGYWLLFGMNAAGTPSVGATLQIKSQ